MDTKVLLRYADEQKMINTLFLIAQWLNAQWLNDSELEKMWVSWENKIKTCINVLDVLLYPCYSNEDNHQRIQSRH